MTDLEQENRLRTQVLELESKLAALEIIIATQQRTIESYRKVNEPINDERNSDESWAEVL